MTAQSTDVSIEAFTVAAMAETIELYSPSVLEVPSHDSVHGHDSERNQLQPAGSAHLPGLLSDGPRTLSTVNSFPDFVVRVLSSLLREVDRETRELFLNVFYARGGEECFDGEPGRNKGGDGDDDDTTI